MTLSVLSFGIATGQLVFIILSSIYALDAIIGVCILKQVYVNVTKVDFENELGE